MNHSFNEAEPVDQGRGAPYRGHIAKLPELLRARDVQAQKIW
jgi:hypothetical protein